MDSSGEVDDDLSDVDDGGLVMDLGADAEASPEAAKPSKRKVNPEAEFEESADPEVEAEVDALFEELRQAVDDTELR